MCNKLERLREVPIPAPFAQLQINAFRIILPFKVHSRPFSSVKYHENNTLKITKISSELHKRVLAYSMKIMLQFLLHSKLQKKLLSEQTFLLIQLEFANFVPTMSFFIMARKSKISL